MRISFFLMGTIPLLFLIISSVATAKDLQDLIDLPVEVQDSLKSKLAESREYTEEQLETITRCLKKSDLEGIINCLSDDGLEDALDIGYMIRDEISDLKDRVCGRGLMEQDRCRKLQDDVKKAGIQVKDFGDQIKKRWSKAVAGGKAYLEKRYELTRLKRKICDRINQDGCWNWLNERLDIHCKPSALDYDPGRLRQCRLKVAQNVWERVSAAK